MRTTLVTQEFGVGVFIARGIGRKNAAWPSFRNEHQRGDRQE